MIERFFSASVDRTQALRGALAIGALAALAVPTLLAIGHVDDRFNIDHVSGVLMGLAQSARDGLFYPPLFDGSYYGGTRFMPLPTLLHAGASVVTGEYLLSGKLVAAASMAGLLAITFWIACARRVPASIALALCATIAATAVGLGAGTSVRFDALPLVLQVAALAVIDLRRSRRAIIIAAVLCSLALLSKLSALAAPVAIFILLLRHERRSAAIFGVLFAVVSLGSMAAFDALTAGRFVQNMTELSVSGTALHDVLVAPIRLIELVARYAPAIIALAPFAVLVLATSRASEGSVFRIALIIAFGITLGVLTDIGADYNHLLDLVVLGVIVASQVWAPADRPSAIALGRLMTAAIFVALLLAFPYRAIDDVVGGLTVGADQAQYDPRPLEDVASGAASLLSEDASIPVAYGQRPIVLDAFMLRRIDQRHPEWVDPLEQRIRAGGFDVVILLRDLDAPDSAAFYATYHFGTRLFVALRESYWLRERRGDFFIYVPAAPGFLQPTP